jgi:peptidyl-prolyl cis-trans isomerase A (cyclophilin A)
MAKSYILLGMVLLTGKAAAQTTPVPLPAPVSAAPTPQPQGLIRVSLTTSMGVITLDLESKRAPVTTANFLRYVDQKRFDGTNFYRAMKLGSAEDGTPWGLIQGGTQNNPKRILKAIAHEPTTKTGIKHEIGTISMARWAPGTATGDFSILMSAMPALDADPTQPGDNAGYAAFGRVVEGMEIVRKILSAPTSPALGQGFMKGQMIAAPVKIISARRIAAKLK